MIDVELDQLVPSVIGEMFSERMTESMLDDLAAGTRAKWISIARQELTTSKEDYIAGIQPVESKPGERVIALVGWLANTVESGLSGFDLRETLLGGGKGRRSASGGYYRPIPFRHGGAGSAGLSGAPAGSQYGPRGERSLAAGGFMSASSARAMGEAIMDVAKRLRASKQAQPRARTSWGDRLQAGLAPKLAPHHKTDIYAGMAKVQHRYGRATQTKYMTFRTISTENPEGWFHPGIEARHLSEMVEDWVTDTAPKLIRQALRGIGR